MTHTMTGRRRLEILNQLAAAPDGLTMFDGNTHRFRADEIAALGSLVAREVGPSGVYHITDEGRRYVDVMWVGKVMNDSAEKVAA